MAAAWPDLFGQLAGVMKHVTGTGPQHKAA
jgi:hypothetical protein